VYNKEIVIGSVPYLNGRPLIRWFMDTEEGRASGIRVIEAVPSVLAKMLEADEIAAALVSSVELFRAPSLTYAPDAVISADGPVESVRLLSRVPIAEIQTVALDTSSLTSVALLKILLAELYGRTPCYTSAPPNLDAMLAECDAALLIGDLGYREYDPNLHVLDLGAAWKELTGLPFSYALWIGRPERLTPEINDALRRAKEWGITHLPRIAEIEHERYHETYERAYHYVAEVMRYDMGEREREALRVFGEKLAAHGLIPEPTQGETA
jgi:chorismate dehydratase